MVMAGSVSAEPARHGFCTLLNPDGTPAIGWCAITGTDARGTVGIWYVGPNGESFFRPATGTP
jgi:hypothetical protein